MLVLLVACRRDAPQAGPEPRTAHSLESASVYVGLADARPPTLLDAAALPTHREVADLGAALHAVIPADARVIGFGELHARTDRAQVKSALSRFTSDGLPAIADQLSDLIVETWLVDTKCGAPAQEATARVSVTMRRPVETKSEIALLAEAARKAHIQPHAMKITCDDYTRIAPPGKEVQTEALLTLTTKELGRIATEAVAHRDREAGHKPWIAVYGGALHNDREPEAGVAEWSYAARVDKATNDRFVEVDLIVPEFAEADPASQKQPWFPLVGAADAKVRVWQRGERSFVIVLPRTAQ